MKLNILELYAGTGRSVEPFRSWSKVGGIYLVDNSQYAADVYLHNYPDAIYKVWDLGKVDTRDLLSLCGEKVDVLLGCPPCQGFSDCGLKDARDPRNSHISRFHKIVRDLRPRVLAMENVPLIVASRRFKQFLRGLEELGYIWTAAIVNAALWGSCQSRQRVILVAAHSELGVQPIFPEPTHGGEGLYFNYSRQHFCKLSDDFVGMLGRTPASQRTEQLLPRLYGTALGTKPVPTINDVLGDLPAMDTPEAARLHHRRWQHSRATLKRMANIAEGKRWKGGVDHFSQTYGRLHRRGLARTITGYFSNAGSGRFWHPTENRALTLREAARIQGFPDGFQFLSNDSENCTLVGNALDRALADFTFRTIQKSLG